MRQARLILVTGLPGTGKSTLAQVLASRYAVPLICKDTIKEPLFDVIGANDRAQSRRFSNASFAVMFSLARDCLRAGTDLILEGNFRLGEHEPVMQALIAPPSKVLLAQLLCRTTESVRVARLKARATDPTRHAGHRDADLAIAGSIAPTAAPSNPSAQSASHFLALPGEHFLFESDARSAAEIDALRLESLLASVDLWYRANTHTRAL